jgi:hypothetical protein
LGQGPAAPRHQQLAVAQAVGVAAREYAEQPLCDLDEPQHLQRQVDREEAVEADDERRRKLPQKLALPVEVQACICNPYERRHSVPWGCRPLVHGVAASSAWGCSLWCMGLQPPVHGVAGLWYMGLQPPVHGVAGLTCHQKRERYSHQLKTTRTW